MNKATDLNTLNDLFKIIEQRKCEHASKSYTASLYEKGLDKILEKFGEESLELILACKNYNFLNNSDNKNALVYETADCLFHLLVALSYSDIKLDEVYSELSRRFNTSGLTEKANRTK